MHNRKTERAMQTGREAKIAPYKGALLITTTT